jgi:hypothetical protein
MANPAKATSPATALAVGTAPAPSDGTAEGGELVSPPPAAEDDGAPVGEPGISVVCMDVCIVGCIMVVSMEPESLTTHEISLEAIPNGGLWWEFYPYEGSLVPVMMVTSDGSEDKGREGVSWGSPVRVAHSRVWMELGVSWMTVGSTGRDRRSPLLFGFFL